MIILNKYLLVDKIVSYNVISQEYFDDIFSKYILITDKKSDIIIDSKFVNEVLINNDNLVIHGDNYYLTCDNGIYTYALEERGKLIGKAICDDKNGIYHFEILVNENPAYVEYIMLQCALSRFFITNMNAIFIHSSCISYNDKALMFCAPSGTGKSTHSALWNKYYDASYINDDKNLIFMENGRLYVYGTPMSGKHHLDSNSKKELIGMVFLRQAKENKLKKLSSLEALIQIMSQIQRPDNKNYLDNINPMIDIITKFPCYMLECTISKEAVDLVKEAYFGGNNNENK